MSLGMKLHGSDIGHINYNMIRVKCLSLRWVYSVNLLNIFTKVRKYLPR